MFKALSRLALPALLLTSCGQPLAEPQSPEGPARAQGTAPTAGPERLPPDLGRPLPAPPLTPEQRERLIDATEIERAAPADAAQPRPQAPPQPREPIE